MKRLCERGGSMSPLEAEAVALLRSVSRFEPPVGMRQRVRARLLSSSPMGARLFRPAFALALLCLGAGASAAIGGSLLMKRYHVATTRGEPSAPDVGLRGRATRAPGIPPLPQDLALATPAAATSAETLADPSLDRPALPANLAVDADPSGSLGTPRASTSRSADGARLNMPGGAAEASKSAVVAATPEKTSDAKRVDGKSSEEVKLVFDSMRALRRDGQPDRAARLLDEYLRRYPGGALAEEALALSIEAAVMLGDPRAKALANSYIARYPDGRFRRVAERARSRFAQ